MKTTVAFFLLYLFFALLAVEAEAAWSGFKVSDFSYLENRTYVEFSFKF